MKEETYVCMQLSHFAVKRRLRQHCKAITNQFKKKKQRILGQEAERDSLFTCKMQFGFDFRDSSQVTADSELTVPLPWSICMRAQSCV